MFRVHQPLVRVEHSSTHESIDWNKVWGRTMVKVREDRTKATDKDRSAIYSLALRVQLPYAPYYQVVRDLVKYPKYDAYALWVNPVDGFLAIAPEEHKEPIEKFLILMGHALHVIP